MKYIVKVGPVFLKAPSNSIDEGENPFVDDIDNAYQFTSLEEANMEACFMHLIANWARIKVTTEIA